MKADHDIRPGSYTIQVRDIDIFNGKRGDGSCCAVALAVRRALDTPEVEVDGSTFRIGSVEGTFAPSVEDFIERFDAGDEHLESFTCELVLEWRKYDRD